MTLPTITNVKAKLEIPAADASRDTAITDVLNSVIQEVLDRTCFDSVGNPDTAAPYQDLFEHVQIGRILVLKKRPVDLTKVLDATGSAKAILIEGRIVGNNLYTKLYGDVVDPYKGRIKVLGYLEFVSFPPQEPPQPWRRWKYPVWPLVRVSYCTTPAVIPADLFDAIAAAAAFRYQRQVGGAVTTASLGGRIGFSSTYKDLLNPEWAEAIFKKYTTKSSATWVGP